MNIRFRDFGKAALKGATTTNFNGLVHLVKVAPGYVVGVGSTVLNNTVRRDATPEAK